MDKFTQMMDLPVIDSANGEKIATVIDVAVKDDTRDIAAIVVATGGMLPAVRLVYPNDAEKLDDTGLYVSQRSAMKNADPTQLKSDVVRFEQDMVGKLVIGQKGEEYGILQDVVFDYGTREMLELQVADEQREKLITLTDGVCVKDRGICL